MELLVLLVFAAVLQSTFAYNLNGEAGYKTYYDAEKEVATELEISDAELEEIHTAYYPDEPGTTDLLCYLTLRNLRAWNEGTYSIKDNVITQFLIPSSLDPLYQQHTEECFAEKVDTLDATELNIYTRAYESFKCYYDNSDGINLEAGWVPYNETEVLKMLQDCMTQPTEPSEDNLVQFCQGQFATNPAYPAIGYCFFVGAGFYTKCTGFDLNKFFIQFGEAAILSDATEACLAQTAGLYCREPERFLRGFLDCLVQFTPAASVIGTAASNVLGNPPECVYPED